MRLLILAMTFSLGCTGSEPDEVKPTDTDTPVDKDTDETDVPVDTGPLPFDSSFSSGRFRFNKLILIGDTDSDDDGVIDNNLPNALNAVDILLASEDFSLDTFNANLQSNIDGYTTIVLADARKLGSEVEIDLLQGLADETFTLTVDPSSYDESGKPNVQLEGFFFDETLMFARADTIVLPISFYEDTPPLQVYLEQVRIDAGLTSTLFAGEITGALPIDELIEKVIDPLVPANGYDYDLDGQIESKEEILALIDSIAPAAGDIDLGNDRRGISCRFTFASEPGEWAR